MSKKRRANPGSMVVFNLTSGSTKNSQMDSNNRAGESLRFVIAQSIENLPWDLIPNYTNFIYSKLYNRKKIQFTASNKFNPADYYFATWKGDILRRDIPI